MAYTRKTIPVKDHQNKINLIMGIAILVFTLILVGIGYVVRQEQKMLWPIKQGSVHIIEKVHAKEVPVKETVECEDAEDKQKCEILAEIVRVFQEDAADAITMIRKCENSSFEPDRMNTANRNGTWDVGVFQMNVNPANTEEVERLKDFRYNIKMAKKKFDAKGSFYYWTCGHEVGHYTYVDYINGR